MSCSGLWRVDLQLLPSRRERRWRVLILLLTLCAVLTAHPPWPAQPLAAAVWMLVAVLCWRSLPSSHPLQRLCQVPGGWRLTLHDGEVVFADLHGPVRDSLGLLCLGWREQAGDVPSGRHPRRWQVALWADQADADSWRRLRVSLRWRRREGPAPNPARARADRGDPACSADRATRDAAARSG